MTSSKKNHQKFSAVLLVPGGVLTFFINSHIKKTGGETKSNKTIISSCSVHVNNLLKKPRVFEIFGISEYLLLLDTLILQLLKLIIIVGRSYVLLE